MSPSRNLLARPFFYPTGLLTLVSFSLVLNITWLIVNGTDPHTVAAVRATTWYYLGTGSALFIPFAVNILFFYKYRWTLRWGPVFMLAGCLAFLAALAFIGITMQNNIYRANGVEEWKKEARQTPPPGSYSNPAWSPSEAYNYPTPPTPSYYDSPSGMADVKEATKKYYLGIADLVIAIASCLLSGYVSIGLIALRKELPHHFKSRTASANEKEESSSPLRSSPTSHQTSVPSSSSSLSTSSSTPSYDASSEESAEGASGEAINNSRRGDHNHVSVLMPTTKGLRASCSRDVKCCGCLIDSGSRFVLIAIAFSVYVAVFGGCTMLFFLTD